MPRLPAKQREAEKVATKLPNGSYAAAVNDSPARFSWEEHAVKLLSKMSGDRRKRKQNLEAFIKALVKKREEFRKEKKTGAGSATEAIEFYHFVVEKNNTWKAKAGKKPAANAQAPGAVAKEDEFLNEHNDLCEVCGIGGELLCCSTCNLVFHLNCVRPALKSMPPDSWSCAHCDATGVTGLKKDSRQRKRAVAAIREMNKLQTEKNKKDPVEGEVESGAVVAVSADTDGASCKICSRGGELFTCNQSVCNNSFHMGCIRPVLESKPDSDWNCAYCDVDFVTGLKPQARKRRAALSGVRAMEKLKVEFDAKGTGSPEANAEVSEATINKRKADELNDEDAIPVHPGQPRSHRLRRQLVAQGDKEKIIQDDNKEEVPIAQPVAPSFTKDAIPPELLKKLVPKATNANSRHGQYACKFCMDDEKIETCCFCACRVCFTKHGKPDTILCDICDGEYHITCLSPPLAQIPTFDWYCPTCTEAITKALSTNAGKTQRVSSGKKGGRPKGSGKAASQTATKKGHTKAKSKLALKLKKAASSAQQPRTSTGRFAAKPKGANVAVTGPIVVKKKRGPGRPPKSATKAAMMQNSTGNSNKATRKSSASSTKTSMSTSSQSVPPHTLKRSRSGRVVKRKAAYDEIEQGAQLMKTSVNPNLGITGRGNTISSSQNLKGPGDSNTKAKAMLSNVAIQAATTAASIMKQNLNVNDKKSSLLQPPKPSVSAAKDFRLQHIIANTGRSSPVVSPKSGTSKVNASTPSILGNQPSSSSKSSSRRKPGARECMQISRRFGAGIIPQNYMDILLDYCSRGKVEHLIRMRERLDEHSRFLELQLAGLECLVLDKGELLHTEVLPRVLNSPFSLAEESKDENCQKNVTQILSADVSGAQKLSIEKSLDTSLVAETSKAAPPTTTVRNASTTTVAQSALHAKTSASQEPSKQEIENSKTNSLLAQSDLVRLGTSTLEAIPTNTAVEQFTATQPERKD